MITETESEGRGQNGNTGREQGDWIDGVVSASPAKDDWHLPLDSGLEPLELPFHEGIAGLVFEGQGFQTRGFGGLAFAEMGFGVGIQVSRAIGLGGDGAIGEIECFIQIFIAAGAEPRDLVHQ
jgi:hypothetical protein